MTDPRLSSISQSSRGIRLHINTSVTSPSLDAPRTQGPSWQSATCPSTPGLLQSAVTSRGSSLYPITPGSLAPWSPGGSMLRRTSDFDAQGDVNSVYSGEPKDFNPWSLRRFGSAFRSLRKKPVHGADPQLLELISSVVNHDLNDWSLVEEVCRCAKTNAANAHCVLKSIIHSLVTGSPFQQLSAGRLWAILMKKANTVVMSQAAHPEFLSSLERAITSPTIEMVASDRMIAVIATIIHEKQFQDETLRFSQLWTRLSSRRTLDAMPLCDEDVLYRPGSLVSLSFGKAHQDATVAIPYTSSDEPSESGHVKPPLAEESESKQKTDSGIGLDRNETLKAVTHERAVSCNDTDAIEQLPPPYSPCVVSQSEAGPSRLGSSVVDTYPFAKGYANDVGPNIDAGSIESDPFAKGAFGDVRRGYLRDGTRVAIKCLRFYTSARDTGRHKLEKKSLKEIQVWSFLNHENVLPLIGICVINNELGMVSEFMPNGNVQEYIQHTPGVDRYRLAIDICAGLTYLHEHPRRVIHGDLKAVNVVVDANGVPKLTDFGLAQMVRAEDSTERSSSSGVGGTARWMAYEQIYSSVPEIVCPRPNSYSDVQSLGMTLYEVFSSKLPFSELRNKAQVILAVMQGVLPTRYPNVFPDPLWHLLNQCWDRNPHARPSARQVLSYLQRIVSARE